MDVKVERFIDEAAGIGKVGQGGIAKGETAVGGLRVGRCADIACALEHLILDDICLRPGILLKARGTICTFRSSNQLLLMRASLVKSTAEEIEVWTKYAEFVDSTLSTPRELSEEEVRKCEEESRVRAREEEKLRREEARKKKARREERRMYEQKKRKYDERQEKKLREEVRELDGNALDRPGWKPLKTSDEGIDAC